MTKYSYKEKQKFYNKDPFLSQLRMVIVESSGSSKTKLLYKFLLDGYLDFQKKVIVSPSLIQKEYDVIIKSLQNGWNINQIKNIFEEQNSITDIDNVSDNITSNDKFKRTKLELQVVNHPDLLTLPHELTPQRIKQTLVIIDDCTIINSPNPIQLFVYGRPLNINTIYLSQKYTNVPATIRENCKVFILFKQSVKTIKKYIYNKIGDQFDNDKEMINFVKVNIKDKHDFILLNKDDGKWFSQINTRLTSLNFKPINSGMGFKEQQSLYPDQRSYLEEKAKAYKAEQTNRQTINDLQHFSSALIERTSEVFKPLTTIQNKSLQQEKEIVTMLKDQNARNIDPLQAIENQPWDLNLKDAKHARRTMSERLIRDPEGTLSKNECIYLIKSDDNMDELLGITKYKDDKICFHIFEDLYNHKLIEKVIVHKIELIEEIDRPVDQTFIRTLIKASRTKTGRVI